MPGTATTYRFPPIELPTELLDSPIEHIELKGNDSTTEHIELKGALSLAKNDKCQREHMRVKQANIEARFIIGVRPKRFRPFTRVFPCQIVNISMGGVCIETTKDLYKDETIVLYFSHHGAEKTDEVPIVGRIVRTTMPRKTFFNTGSNSPRRYRRVICKPSFVARQIAKKVGHDPANSN
ncbi:MAG: PilZ domain-containing protein [Gammaproteobacteria bacterium]